ncbi:uncharacterized protein PSFLO_05161 [Pseudozyma flocculosa]|uniref:Uncharacterized protein n=1 Tax=Pseudozyma flocculosa TaxID=84751 RepID=A0A5C3F6A9_9BASI|nr:uncharacterized protein PSFLO_05161 [Pseudozyma flocculosa]
MPAAFAAAAAVVVVVAPWTLNHGAEVGSSSYKEGADSRAHIQRNKERCPGKDIDMSGGDRTYRHVVVACSYACKQQPSVRANTAATSSRLVGTVGRRTARPGPCLEPPRSTRAPHISGCCLLAALLACCAACLLRCLLAAARSSEL